MAKKKGLKRSSNKRVSMMTHRLNAASKQNRKMKGWF